MKRLLLMLLCAATVQAQVKISEMPVVTTLGNTDKFIVLQGGVTDAVAWSSILSELVLDSALAPKASPTFTGTVTIPNGAILGTPTSMTATNITGTASGLTAGTASAVAVGGITGLGTGVATALAVNVGTAGAPVVFNGALGTPSSGTVTNLTGTASININGTVGATTPNTGVFTTATLAAGSVGSPSLKMLSTDTAGWYSSGANQWMFETGGTTLRVAFLANLIRMDSSEIVGWAASNAGTSMDTGLGRNGVGVVEINNGNAISGTSNTGDLKAGAATFLDSGAASTPALTLSGVPFAGTGTTSFPLVYINDSNATASTTLNTAGTYFGVNGDGTQDLMKLMTDGVAKVQVASTGTVSISGDLTSTGAGTASFGRHQIGNTGNITFSDGSNYNRGIMQSNSAIEINTGSAISGTSNAYPIRALAFIPAGTATTCTGATIGTGSKSNAGFITATTTGASSIVITFPVTAPTGWNVEATNMTNAATPITMTAHNATTATLAGTTASGDVITYIAMPY